MSEKFCWYIAGPLFNSDERNRIEKFGQIFKNEGFNVYIPHKQGFLVSDIAYQFQRVYGFDSTEAMNAANKFIFDIDIYALVEKCHGIFATLDGRVPDEGMIAEAAIAWTIGKPVILYKSDDRALVGNLDNPMIRFLSSTVCHSKEDIFDKLKNFSPIPAPRQMYHNLPEEIRRTAQNGKILWDVSRVQKEFTVSMLETEYKDQIVPFYTDDDIIHN